MILVLSKKEIDELDSSIFTLNHKICRDIVHDVYPLLKDKPKILITDEYIKENYYLNEEKAISIIKSMYYLTGYPIVYMTKTLDYISSKYNTNEFIVIINEDVLTYPVMLLDNIVENTDLTSPIKSNSETLSDGIYAIDKYTHTLKMCSDDPEIIQYVVTNLPLLKKMIHIFDLLKQDNSILKSQLNTKITTYDNVIEKIKILEEDREKLLSMLKQLSVNYKSLYNSYANKLALVEEYNKIYDALSIYGVYNEAMSIKKFIDTSSINISKAPIILYLKEYSVFPMFKEFILKLPILLKENSGILSKVIVLENSDSIREVEYDNFTPYTHGLILSQFLDYDFWVNYGNPHDILSLISHNEASQDIYIIWDRTYINSDYVVGPNVIHLNLLETVYYCNNYKLKPNSCIAVETTPIISSEKYKGLLKTERLLHSVLSKTKLYTEIVRLYEIKKERLNGEKHS